MSKLRFSSLLFSFALVVSSSFASADNDPYGDLFRAMDDVQQYCRTDRCGGGYRFDLIVQGSRMRAPTSLYKVLHNSAQSQAALWLDTILSEPFEVRGPVRLDIVSELRRHGRLVAYRLTYSRMAWLRQNCDARGPHPSNCIAGSIIESSYASPDFRALLTDDTNPAHFVRR